MLKNLYIKNFVLIDELNLSFEEGFSVFLGETGAGKSILIDALSLLRADRASSSLVAKGSETAIVEGTFDLSNDKNALNVLKEAGFEVEPEEVTFTRELNTSGKSTARIDHRIVTLSLMKEILQNQIDIHGQRDNQYLLNPSTHINLLDAYLEDSKLKEEVSKKYHAYKELVDEKETALKETYNESDLEFFTFQLNEINSADLQPGEDTELENKEKEYKAVKSSFEKLNSLIEGYDNDIAGSFHELYRLSESLEDTELLTNAKESIKNSYFELSDAIDSIRKAFDSLELSEDEINQMEERLFTIQKLKRKYGDTIEAIFEKRDDLEKQIHVIEHRQEYLNEIDAKIEKALAEYNESAAKLSKVRKDGSKKLDKQVESNLKDLILPNARFKTDINVGKPSELGSDKVEFLISMNKGEDLKPLVKTASGGEISRLMLGLKEIFSKLQGIETAIFDEIDTGVSGQVATAIGKKMSAIAESTQVFAVTHLAPVAACASNHYFVSKSEENGRTYTHVTKLTEDKVIEQLALIASGEITKTSLAAAKELRKRNAEG